MRLGTKKPARKKLRPGILLVTKSARAKATTLTTAMLTIVYRAVMQKE